MYFHLELLPLFISIMPLEHGLQFRHFNSIPELCPLRQGVTIVYFKDPTINILNVEKASFEKMI